MNVELTQLEFRRLLDLVYVGNWVLPKQGMRSLIETWRGHIFPSAAYEDGGIHEAIADYEDAVFFDILAEELARRDLDCLDENPEDMTELNQRMEEYISEFEQNGLDNVSVEL